MTRLRYLLGALWCRLVGCDPRDELFHDEGVLYKRVYCHRHGATLDVQQRVGRYPLPR